MGSEWKTVNLSSCASFQEGYVNPTQKKPEYFDGDIKWLRATDLNGSFVYSTSRTLSEAGYKSAGKSAYLFEPDTLAISKSGTIGRLGILKDYMCGNRAVINIKPDKAKVDPLFIFYVLSSRRHEIENLAIGSVQPNLYTSALGTIQFKKPKLEEQKNISYILASIDNKIQLNRETNKTLEQMAQALFKSWFVDFDPVIDNALAAGKPIPEELQARAQRRQQQLAKPDHQPLPDDVRQLFPSEFEETEALGWVPKGWRVSNIKSFGRVVTGKTPPKSVEGAYDEVGFPFITPTDIDDSIFVAKVNRYLSDKGASVINKNKIPKGSVCVSCIGSQMGKTVISPTAAYTNQQINSVVVTDDFSRNYLFYNLRGRREELFSLGASGSTMPILNKSSFEKLLVLKPSDRILRKYQEFTGEQMESVYQRFIQIESLENLRNTLLPKLISGELRLPESLLDSETNPPETAYE
ncbi:restriction endonuclease subunit S [Neptuniibacter pectenicola]|uniref:restriction endonuclease subunit S n=1 Tax=Neptuniibacter pectenicola TaxID=1806669 RepID=UPI00082B146B|nr:restriction endonuclease subunit S [Neptuniibacter pectenicola]